MDRLLPTLALWKLGDFIKEKENECQVREAEDIESEDIDYSDLTYIYHCLHSEDNLNFISALCAKKDHHNFK